MHKMNHFGPSSCTLMLKAIRHQYSTVVESHGPISDDKQNMIQSIVSDVEQNVSWGSGHGGFGLPRKKVIQRWLQLGKDPVVNAPKNRQNFEFQERRAILREDMLGTDITSGDKKHNLQSRLFWKKIIKDKALGEMRQKSQGMSDVGKLSFNTKERTIASDPADVEATRWEQDPNFTKCIKTCESIFGTKPENMKDFEIVLENASADQLFHFWGSARQQLESQSYAMLGLASVTYYEGEELKDYCRRIKPLNDERRDFVSTLIADINRCGGWPVVADRIAKTYSKVYEIFRQRRTRQIDTNILKSWVVMNEDEQVAFCLAERDWYERRIVSGTFDPESNDTSDEWKKENLKLHDILNTNIIGCSFSLQTYWEIYERVAELQREHMFTIYANKIKFAKCYQRLRNELNGNEDIIYSSYVTSLQKSTFDFGNGVLIPHMTEIWCKLNWPFFGSAGYKQNSANGKRVYMFHHGTPSQVKAIAQAFYNTRPLSESIDYSSPYAFRQSHANILAEAGVNAMEDRANAVTCAETICDWEEDLSAVVQSVKSRIGKVRRRYQEIARNNFLNSNDSGGPLSKIILSLPKHNDECKKWVVGSKATVSFQWQPPDLTMIPEATEGKRKMLEYERRRKGRIEVSLWCRKTKKEYDDSRLQVASVQRTCSQELMRDVSFYTLWFYQNIVNSPTSLDADSEFFKDADLRVDSVSVAHDENTITDDSEHTEWEFVTMLDDNVELGETTTYNFLLPFAFSGLNQEVTTFRSGEHRVRVRCFRYDANPNRHPVRCVQQHSEPFYLEDTVSEHIKCFVGEFTTDEWFPAVKLPMLVQHLRSHGFEISIDTEFSLGQRITPKGEISTDYILKMLRSGIGSKNPCLTGISDDEIAAEKNLFKRFDEMFPGATIDEWMSARRAVFNTSFYGSESAWWIGDDLETDEITMRNLNEPVWYIHDKITSLSARGSFCDQPGTPLAEVEVECTGVPTHIALKKKNNITVDQAVTALHGSLHNAHTRFSFLAQGKMGPLLDKINMCIADTEHGYNGYASWGGKYLRTIHFCFTCAERNLRHKMDNFESMLRSKDIERWSSPDYKFRTEKPTQEYRLGPHEALEHTDVQWPR